EELWNAFERDCKRLRQIREDDADNLHHPAALSGAHEVGGAASDVDTRQLDAGERGAEQLTLERQVLQVRVELRRALEDFDGKQAVPAPVGVGADAERHPDVQRQRRGADAVPPLPTLERLRDGNRTRLPEARRRKAVQDTVHLTAPLVRIEERARCLLRY